MHRRDFHFFAVAVAKGFYVMKYRGSFKGRFWVCGLVTVFALITFGHVCMANYNLWLKINDSLGLIRRSPSITAKTLPSRFTA